MREDLVRQEQHGPVTVLTINRPEKKNAFNDPLYRAMTRALAAAQADPQTRVVVITGAGETFSAGQDFTEMSAEGSADHGFPAFMDALMDFDKPIVTAVNGAGVGIGFTMLLHTDITYIAEGARLRAPFVTLGVVPEAASSLLLPSVTGYQKAAEILFTARWISAEESVALGLALAVVPGDRLLEVACAKASEIAAQPPGSVRQTKRLLRIWRRQAIAEARRREDEAFLQRLGTPENVEAIRAFFERRAPDFSKIPPE